MARIDVERDERERIPALTLGAILECEGCEEEFEGLFTAPPGVEDMEDIEEPDKLIFKHKCANCGHEGEYKYPGWTIHGDAG